MPGTAVRGHSFVCKLQSSAGRRAFTRPAAPSSLYTRPASAAAYRTRRPKNPSSCWFDVLGFRRQPPSADDLPSCPLSETSLHSGPWTGSHHTTRPAHTRAPAAGVDSGHICRRRQKKNSGRRFRLDLVRAAQPEPISRGVAQPVRVKATRVLHSAQRISGGSLGVAWTGRRSLGVRKARPKFFDMTPDLRQRGQLASLPSRPSSTSPQSPIPLVSVLMYTIE